MTAPLVAPGDGSAKRNESGSGRGDEDGAPRVWPWGDDVPCRRGKDVSSFNT